ncbi:hypothetical protein [Sphaerisporangium perillae]|uniref:hypothetical protein n=1 Tax=Sphaerisporangium perillae TaxID=2935860 RepID=UPI002010A8C5|nr:hypothetical protein [Sphaerisporangium perillae]
MIGLPLARGAEERFAGMLTDLGVRLRRDGMRTLLVRTVRLRLRSPKGPGLIAYREPEMTVRLPGDPRPVLVSVERGRCGPMLRMEFPSGGVPVLRLRATDIPLAVGLLHQLFGLSAPPASCPGIDEVAR